MDFSSYVLSETLTLLRRREGHPAAVGFLDRFSSIRELRVHSPTREEEQEALRLFRLYQEIPLSHCDCVTAAMMRARRAKEIFTFDEDFRALGFQVLPG